jgi:hypothetical protein
MITESRKLVIPDESGKGNHITMVINWNKNIKDCEYIKLLLPNGSETIVQKDKFRTLMMMIAKDEEIEAMGKQEMTTVKVLRGHISVAPKKKIVLEPGQTYPIPYEIPLKVPIDIIKDQEGFKPR